MESRQTTRDYIIQHIMSVEALRTIYPTVKFYELAPGISHIAISEGQEAELNKIKQGAVAVFTPILMGLNISGVLEETNIQPFQQGSFIQLTGKGTMIGFVDTGIQYTNNLFKYEDNTTRIKAIWDQTIEGNPPMNYGVDNYDFGSVYMEEDINRALASEDPYSIVPSKDTNGHGTYLAGVAAGKDRTGAAGYTGGAPDADIVVVKLREAKEYLKRENLLQENAVAYEVNDIMEGINCLIKFAHDLDKTIAICIALGSNYGAHNGLTLIERFLNDKSNVYDVILVSSAGNEGNTSHHYSNRVKQGETQEIEINVGAGEKGVAFAIWASGVDKLEVGFRTPLGNTVDVVPINFEERQEFKFNLEKSQVTIDYEFPNLTTGSQSIEVRFVNPVPGIWRLYVHGKYILSGDYNIWLPREEFIKESTRFLRPDPETTVCIPSTADKVIVVGGYDIVTQGICPSSGRGPTTSEVIKPDIIAPGVNVPGPDLIGGYTTKTGTGAAAAITTAACSLLLQWAIVEQNFNLINTSIARTILIRGARRDPGISYPNPIEGYGKLDLKNSIKNI